MLEFQIQVIFLGYMVTTRPLRHDKWTSGAAVKVS